MVGGKYKIIFIWLWNAHDFFGGENLVTFSVYS